MSTVYVYFKVSCWHHVRGLALDVLLRYWLDNVNAIGWTTMTHAILCRAIRLPGLDAHEKKERLW